MPQLFTGRALSSTPVAREASAQRLPWWVTVSGHYCPRMVWGRKGDRTPRGELMDALMLRRVAVWMDEFAPGAGAFPRALDWAARLGLPLYPVTASLSGRAHEAAVPADTLRRCAAACARNGVAWDVALPGSPAGCFPPGELCVFGADRPQTRRAALLQ